MKLEKTVIRVLGTSVTLIDKIRLQAEKDLNIELQYIVKNAQEAQKIAVLEPETYDVYDQWFHNVDLVWTAQSIQPIDIKRIDLWEEVNSLPKTGRVDPTQKLAPGSEPSGRLYVQHDNSLGARPSNLISMLPLAHNVDSFAYNVNLLPKVLRESEESWSWFLHPTMKGKVCFQNDAAIGAIDATIAIIASGLLKFTDPSNLEIDEIDELIKVLKNKKDLGQFLTFWNDHEQSIELLKSNRSIAQSIWSPVYYRNKCNNLGYKLACPKEGYRAWCGGLSISKCTKGKELDKVYEYLNWWLSGWPGAIIARQGYYISNTNTVKNYLSENEWNFWYEGKKAVEDLEGVDGQILVPSGSVRSGGSYYDRMSNIAIWNSVMDEHNYLVRKWRELIKY